MRRLRASIVRLCGLFTKRRHERELADELEGHLQMHIEDNLRSGMTPGEARRDALIRLGGLESTKEACRDRIGFQGLETLLQDLSYGWRMLFKNPGFTGVAVLTLGLGLGANTVVLSVAKAILFRPLGIEAPEQVVWLNLTDRQTGQTGENFSWTDFTDLQTEGRSFEQLALIGWPGVTWEHGDHVEHLTSLVVTPSLFDVLRIHPVLGRRLFESDGEASAGSVALISHELWQGRFAGDPEILGQVLRLNETLHTVIGILPPHLEFPLGHSPSAGTGATRYAGVHDVWLPLRVGGVDRTARGNRMFPLIARLRGGVSVAMVRGEVARLGARWASAFPETNRGLTVEAIGYRDKALGGTRKAIYILAVSVAAVLLVCCVNLANLLLARGVTRQRESAVRQALGAGRGRMVRALLTESLLLSLPGGVVGIVLAEGAVRLIRSFGPAEVPFIGEVIVDGSVMAFTAALCFATALVFGLLPALWQSRIDPAEALKSGTRSSAGPQIRAWQRSLLIGQIALVSVLLTSAGLLLESFRRLMSVDLGYQPKAVIALDLGNWDLPTNADGVHLYREIRSRLAALPGVEAVGTIQSTPLTGKWTWEERVQILGRSVPTLEQPFLAVTFIAFDYFAAMGIPLVSGRFFHDAELQDNEYAQISILNETAAAKLFPDETALGKRFSISSSPERFYEVIGIVKDTRDMRLDHQPQPRFYFLYTHGGSQVIVRSSVPAQAMIPLLRETVKQFGRRVIINDIKPMTAIVSDTVSERRFLMAMLIVYAVVALGIAAAGIFGVVAYQVAQRTNEFGIRLALGARPMELMQLVLVQSGRLVLAGLAVGLLLSLVAGRLLSSQIFGLSPHDPVLLATVGTLFLFVALLASFSPARRAARLDPMMALRCE